MENKATFPRVEGSEKWKTKHHVSRHSRSTDGVGVLGCGIHGLQDRGELFERKNVTCGIKSDAQEPSGRKQHLLATFFGTVVVALGLGSSGAAAETFFGTTVEIGLGLPPPGAAADTFFGTTVVIGLGLVPPGAAADMRAYIKAL